MPFLNSFPDSSYFPGASYTYVSNTVILVYTRQGGSYRFRIPYGLTSGISINYRVIGGGGGGQAGWGNYGGAGGAGAGGGAGQTVVVTTVPLNSGDIVTLNIGSGGGGGGADASSQPYPGGTSPDGPPGDDGTASSLYINGVLQTSAAGGQGGAKWLGKGVYTSGDGSDTGQGGGWFNGYTGGSSSLAGGGAGGSFYTPGQQGIWGSGGGGGSSSNYDPNDFQTVGGRGGGGYISIQFNILPQTLYYRFNNIQNEFGGTNPIYFSEYYRDGAFVQGQPTIPASGSPIYVSNFINKRYQYPQGETGWSSIGSGSIYVPAGHYSVRIRAVAGGGGGGSGSSSAYGGGGGSGAYSDYTISCQPGDLINWFASGGGGPGQAGGNTVVYLNRSLIINLQGGQSGGNYSPGGKSPDTSGSGGSGGAGILNGNTGNSGTTGGPGGSNPYGSGGAVGGGNGTLGAGAGGGINGSGGIGGPGSVNISWSWE